MTRWNPNDPNIIGPEVPGAIATFSTTLGTTNRIQAQQFRSNSAETISNCRFYGQRTSRWTTQAQYIAEVVAAGNEATPTSALAVTEYAPNASYNLGSGTASRQPGGQTTNLYSALDEADPFYEEWVSIPFATMVDLEFGTAAFTMTGRIRSVGMRLGTMSGWGSIPDGNVYSRRATCHVVVDGADTYGYLSKTIPYHVDYVSHGESYFDWGEINPYTLQPWTQADIRAFDTSMPTTPSLRFRIEQKYHFFMLIGMARMIVLQESSEVRLARGAFPNTTVPTSPGWTSDIPLKGNDGTGTWAKGNATNYSMLFRRTDQGDLSQSTALFDAPQLPSIYNAGGVYSPPDLLHKDIDTTTYTIPRTGAFPGTIACPTTAGLRPSMSPFLLIDNGAATSADSQPYVDVRQVQVYSGSGANESEFRTSSTDDYGGMLLIAGAASAARPPTAELVIQVRRRSDSVLMGTFRAPHGVAAPLTVGTALVEAEADTPASLASGVQYYVTYSSLTPAAEAWVVGLLTTGGGGTAHAAATYGGSTDIADPIGGAAASGLSYAPADFEFTLTLATDPPTGLAVTSELAAVNDPPGGSCAVNGIPFAEITWTVGAITGFTFYELQRRAVDGVNWETIARITSEGVDTFRDYEARLGIQEAYRIRAAADPGGYSVWTDYVTVTLVTAGVALTFTSNESPELSVAYADVYGESDAERGYAFPEASEVQSRTMHGRDYQVTFRPLSRRGVQFDRVLLVGAIVAPASGVGPPAAEMLRDLAQATLSYVCVRDSDGNRWFGTMSVSGLAVLQPAQVHRAAISFIETTSTPSISDSQP